MSQAKKQHYVPKFYLKNFSINSNRKTIQCLDKVNLRSHISNFKVIAQEEKFNESDSQDIEDNLSKIENDASKLINNFLDNPKYKRLNSEPFKLKLAYFILIQLIRTKEVRNRPIDGINSLKSYMSNKHDLKDSEIKKFNQDEIKEAHLDFIQDDNLDLLEGIFCKKWILLKNQTSMNFWTSDNPVVKYNPYGNLGLIIDGIQLFFPLSPKFSLCILDPFCYSNFKEYKEFDILDGFNNIKKAGLSKITDINDVKFVNSLQIKYSTEYVFSCENEFEENGKIKQWICDVIEESSNESKVKTEEVKTNLDGKLFRQHYS
jgi:hypothetical protein